MEVEGLENKLTIQRDQWGVPHVSAQSSADAFFGQGFVQAQDRIGQMEYDRRRAHGEWAEIAGSGAVNFDKFVRRCGLRQAADREYNALSPAAQKVLDAFAAGVNAYLLTNQPLPPDLSLIRLTPDPWSPQDCCAVFLMRHVVFANWQKKLWRGRLINALGADEVIRLHDSEDRMVPLITGPPDLASPSSRAGDPAVESVLAAMAQLAEPAAGSNAWALSGARTATGRPLIAGDPHRAIEAPSIYYQCHLRAPEFDAIGLAFVGVPGFPHFGHSQHTAWAITNANGDYQDLYVEPAVVRSARIETIAVRDAAPIEIECYETERGPIVFGDPASGASLALRSTALVEASSGLEVLDPMLRATTTAELDAVMASWVDPVNNFVSADTQGSIAYRTVGRIPLRDRANSWGPVAGGDPQFDWTGDIPFTEMPQSVNPESGLIVTANQQIASDDYPYFMGFDYSRPDRALRLHDRLDDMNKASVDDMRAVLRDRVSLGAQIWVPLVLEALEGESEFNYLSSIFSGWDYSMDPDSVAATLYVVIRDFVGKEIADNPIFDSVRLPYAEEPAGAFQPLSLRLWVLLTSLLEKNDTSLISSGQSWSDLLRSGVASALDYLRREIGSDESRWQWGKLHQCAPRHPFVLGSSPETRAAWAQALNPPSVGMGGEWDTVMCAAHPAGYGFGVITTSVARYVFAVGDWDECAWIVPLGASGDSSSPHYCDQQEKWAAGEMVPMAYSPAAVDAVTVATVELVPKT